MVMSTISIMDTTYLRKFCKFPYGTYSITRAIGSVSVHAPIIDTMLGWEPRRFIRFISAKRSSLYEIGAESESKC